MSNDGNWTTETLYEALAQSEPAGDGAIEMELVEGTDPGILITMAEFGDLPLLMSVSGGQILVETLADNAMQAAEAYQSDLKDVA